MNNKIAQSNAQIIEGRIELVATLLIRGLTRSQIIKLTLNPSGKYNWDVSNRQVDQYLSRARALIKKNTKASKKQFFDMAVARYQDLYLKNYNSDDYRECRAVQDSLNKLVGVNEPEKTDLTTNGESLNAPYMEIMKAASQKKLEDE